MIDEPEFVAETLAWCNARRAEQDKEPLDRLPRGRRWDPGSCPCGKATGLQVSWSSYSTKNFTHSKMLPSTVVHFVNAFDSGELPQYDEERA